MIRGVWGPKGWVEKRWEEMEAEVEVVGYVDVGTEEEVSDIDWGLIQGGRTDKGR